MTGWVAWAPVILALLAATSPAQASKLILKDGRIIEGRIALVSNTVDNPKAAVPEGVADNRPIVLVDDDLRRWFIPRGQVAEFNESDTGEPVEKFLVRQTVAGSGSRVVIAGPLVQITEFDDYGRRILEMATREEVIAIVQGITEITPTYTKVEGLNVEGQQYVWDMRIATSSLPRETLGKILARQIDPLKIDQRLKVVRLYLQSERYKDAEDELKEIINDFPEQKDRFGPTVLKLHQAYARRIVAEIELRQAGGQHALALGMLNNFPTEDVAGETLQAVREMLEQYQANYKQGTEVLKQFDAHVALIQDSKTRERLAPVRDELFAQLNLNTLERLAAYQQFASDDSMSPEEKVALAVSGWLLGANHVVRNLPVALSLYDVRNLTRQYLNEKVKLSRQQILEKLHSQEGATPEHLARLLALMTPPLEVEKPADETPGFFQLQVDGLKGTGPVLYYVQLPPEYDPHRRYPTIVTLHGAATTPQQQIDWWAGAAGSNGQRLGQAGRHGYIVIAPAWAKEHQRNYGYSALEHAAVLNSLRDACRRFSVDTDRVYLTGHSMGGDAAWDLGVSHPDLWAGIIPFTAVADKFIAHYWENAQYVPFYLVSGELDGDKTKQNARDLDRYLRRGMDCTVVQFLGRGHEHFSDEILQLFDWMSRRRRNFFPKAFTCRSMRPWDNYFWWVEVDDLPARSIADPEAWPPPRNTIAAQTDAVANASNGINVTTGAGNVTLWLSPEVIDFTRPTTITVKGGRLRTDGPFLEPDLTVMLEDARTRADRQHPFWAKVEMPAGRVNQIEP